MRSWCLTASMIDFQSKGPSSNLGERSKYCAYDEMVS